LVVVVCRAICLDGIHEVESLVAVTYMGVRFVLLNVLFLLHVQYWHGDFLGLHSWVVLTITQLLWQPRIASAVVMDDSLRWGGVDILGLDPKSK